MTSQQWEWDPSARLLTTAEAATSVGVPETRIRKWASRRLITAVAWQRPDGGRGHLQPLYLELDILTAESRARSGKARSGATRRGTGRHVAPKGDEVTSCDQGGEDRPAGGLL